MISFASAEQIADAVLREGRVLYPYRASAAKNQLRWQFGVLAPRSFCEAEGSDRWSMTTVGLLDGAQAATQILVRVRYGRSRARMVRCDGEAVASAEIDGSLVTSFDETIEEQIDAGPVTVERLSASPLTVPLVVAASTTSTTSGRYAVSLAEESVTGQVTVSATSRPGPFGLVEVSVVVSNTTDWSGQGRHDALASSLLSTHILLGTDTGRWLSAIDPPEFADPPGRDAQQGCFPVLIGDDRVVLAAPIILYDHPEIAPESAGDFCDATEIDEILALRTLTLTDEEKREARATDAQAAAILDRCDQMPPEIWARLHGTIRSMASAQVEPGAESVIIDGTEVATGSRVRLHPVRAADAQDLFLDGKSAAVCGVFRDLDGEVHLAVVLDDDPGADLHEWYGRFRYFKPQEIEVLR